MYHNVLTWGAFYSFANINNAKSNVCEKLCLRPLPHSGPRVLYPKKNFFSHFETVLAKLLSRVLWLYRVREGVSVSLLSFYSLRCWFKFQSYKSEEDRNLAMYPVIIFCFAFWSTQRLVTIEIKERNVPYFFPFHDHFLWTHRKDIVQKASYIAHHVKT